MAVAVCQRWVGRIILTGGYYRYCALKGASFSLRLFSSSSSSTTTTTAAAHNIGFRYGDTTEGGEGAKEAATRHTRAKVERTSSLPLQTVEINKAILHKFHASSQPTKARQPPASALGPRIHKMTHAPMFPISDLVRG